MVCRFSTHSVRPLLIYAIQHALRKNHILYKAGLLPAMVRCALSTGIVYSRALMHNLCSNSWLHTPVGAGRGASGGGQRLEHASVTSISSTVNATITDCTFSTKHFCQKLLKSNNACWSYSEKCRWCFLRHSVHGKKRSV